MSTPIHIVSMNAISPLGMTATDNYQAIVSGRSGIDRIDDGHLCPSPIYASQIADDFNMVKTAFPCTRLERMCIASIRDALSLCSHKINLEETVFLFSTTKGNISELAREASFETLSLSHTATRIATELGIPNTPVTISNACISGVMALIVAKRLLTFGQYRHAIVCGADELSRFVISGFQSLHAVSALPCRPFDAGRDGITLGEGAATFILSTDATLSSGITLGGDAITNDANHISGPSRTGAELADAVQCAMHESQILKDDLAFISAHGTATIYNDEMESRAFAALDINAVPLHSLKGYFGHTLGAAGLIESAMSVCAMRDGVVPASANFLTLGAPAPLNVLTHSQPITQIHSLKTASGFGGCNAAIIFTKVNT